MSKYIDADKLKAEIERYESTAIDAYNPHGEDADFWYGKVVACEDLKTLITSLQQEQPEVDLDFQVFAKEMDAVFNLPKEVTENTEANPLNWEYAIARHFYELGKNSK